MRSRIAFLKISRGDSGTSLGHPPYYLTIPTARKFLLISSVQSACGAASGDVIDRGHAHLPPHVYSLDGMAHVSCFFVKTALSRPPYHSPQAVRGDVVQRWGGGRAAAFMGTSIHQELLLGILCIYQRRENIAVMWPGVSLKTTWK